MASPVCQVKDGAGAYAPTTNGFNTTPAGTTTINLVSGAGVKTWAISVVGTDELLVAATVNAGLTVDGVALTCAFTAPAAGSALLFKSTVTDSNGAVSSTTFAIYTLTGAGLRVGAVGETTEGSAAFGYTATINAKIRQAAGGGSTLPVNRPAVEKGASYTLVSTTDHLVTFTGAGPWTATLPASPTAGDEYVIANESSANVTVAGNGNAFLVAGSNTIAPGQAVTFIKSTSANWIAS